MVLSNTQQSYIRLAEQAARRSDQKKRHGSVVVKSGRVLGVGSNHFRTTTRYPQFLWTFHSEMDSMLLRSAGVDISGATMYNVRLLRDDTLAESRPCEMCLWFLKEHGLRQVIYSTNIGFERVRV